MFLWTLFIAVIFSGSASGVEVKVAAGDEAVFRPEKSLPSPVNSIAWKYRSNNVVVIVIEWDEDGFNAPNDRFKDITILNEKTGEMKIKSVNVNHIGEYFFEVNSKEQEEKFTLIVANRVQKPVIEIESTENPNVVYLRCEYSETIIWRNSAGKTLLGSKITPKGESITVTKNGDPESFYTCSLRNDVSEETSDRIYEKDLFKGVPGGLSSGGIAGIIIAIIIIIIIIGVTVFLYKRYKTFDEFFQCLPCWKGYQPAQTNENGGTKAQGDHTAVPMSTTVETNNPEKEIQVDMKKNDDAEEQGGNVTKPTGGTKAQGDHTAVPMSTTDETNNPGKENQGVDVIKTDETNNPGKENQGVDMIKNVNLTESDPSMSVDGKSADGK